MFNIFFIFKFATARRSNCTKRTTIDINQFGFEKKTVRFKSEWERDESENEQSNPLRLPFGGSVKHLMFFSTQRSKSVKTTEKSENEPHVHLNEVCSEMFFFFFTFFISVFPRGNTWHIRSQVCHLGFFCIINKIIKNHGETEKMMHYLT